MKVGVGFVMSRMFRASVLKAPRAWSASLLVLTERNAGRMVRYTKRVHWDFVAHRCGFEFNFQLFSFPCSPSWNGLRGGEIDEVMEGVCDIVPKLMGESATLSHVLAVVTLLMGWHGFCIMHSRKG